MRALFSPLYPLLPLVVAAYVAVAFALHPFSPFYTHHLADPDDYMRLNQVAAWLQGQSWYDLSVPRMSPGAHTVVHWSRLIDLPIALLALPFIPAFGVNDAVLIAALVVPLLWLAVLLALLVGLAGMLGGRDRAGLACVMVLFAPMLLFDYTPGRVDHHGVQAIIAGFALLGFGQIVGGNRPRQFAVMVAAALACGFWIGAEALPWAIMFIACLGVAAAWSGGRVAGDAAIFGVCLPLFTALLIAAALPASDFSSRALSWFSPAYVLFTALSGGILVIGWAVGRYLDNRILRLALYAVLGAAATVAFFILIPSALNGPFADYDTFDATMALDNISEAMPLSRGLHINRFMPASWVAPGVTVIRLLALPLTGLIVCLWMSVRTQAAPRWRWLANAVFLGVAVALTIFWQIRVGIFMELFALAPLAFLLCRWWDRLAQSLRDRPLFWTEVGAFMLLGPLPVVLLPVLIARTPLYPDLLLFPAARAAPACALPPVAAFLNDSAGLGSKPLTIMNGSDSGPELLFTTRHKVIAGNFDVPGNADAYAFFSATDDAVAQAAARRWHADLVLICKDAPGMYLGKNYYAPAHTRLQADKDGMLRMTNIDPVQPLIQRLIRGNAPDWLKPIEIPGGSDYLLFRITYPTVNQ